MFKNKKVVKESTLDKMRARAMKREDYETVKTLNDVESELQSKMLKQRIRGMADGYGSAIAGFTIGAIIATQIKSKKK